jgi:hypothetical protein
MAKTNFLQVRSVVETNSQRFSRIRNRRPAYHCDEGWFLLHTKVFEYLPNLDAVRDEGMMRIYQPQIGPKRKKIYECRQSVLAWHRRHAAWPAGPWVVKPSP